MDYNILYQDNNSSILLKTNGKASRGVKKGDVSEVWCPTGDMIADYATKPLQGSLFKKFRDEIMGIILTKGPGPGKKAVNKKGSV